MNWSLLFNLNWAFAVTLNEFLTLLPQDIATSIVLHLIKILTIKEFTTKDELIFVKLNGIKIRYCFFSLPISICLETQQNKCLCNQNFFVATLTTFNNRLKPSYIILVCAVFLILQWNTFYCSVKGKLTLPAFLCYKFISFHGLIPLCSPWVFKERNCVFLLNIVLLMLLFQFYRTTKGHGNICQQNRRLVGMNRNRIIWKVVENFSSIKQKQSVMIT